MLEKVSLVRGLSNMSGNIVNVYVLRLPSLKNSPSVSIDPQMWKI